MAIFDEATLERHLSRLMRVKLGIFFYWKLPNTQNTVGPFEPRAFADFELLRRRIVEACQKKLRGYSDQEIRALVDEDLNDRNEIQDEWSGYKEDEIRALPQFEPPWFASGFGHPAYVADFVYWSQSPYFTYHEALMLSLGVEPKRFTEADIAKWEAEQKTAFHIWPPLQYMFGRQEQIRRQFHYSHDGDRVYPNELFDWFDLVELEIHPEFSSRYVTRARPNSDNALPLAKSKPHKREVDTISQLFAAMAIEYYGYNPKSRRSPVPKEIVELAATMGIEITDDTVRKYLRVGASFIPDDWEPQ